MRLSPWLKPALGAVLLAVNVGVILLVARSPQWQPQASLGGYRVDLDVYRLGARAWLAGKNLYAPVTTTFGTPLPYLYPPLSAMLFTTVAYVPFWLASTVITAASVGSLAFVLPVLLRSLGIRAAGSSLRWLQVGVLLPVALLFEPVRSTIEFGQINIILMVMVALDCLVARPRWPRGLMIGVAAAMKLTPAAFVLYFLLRRDWRSALNAGVAFGICAALGFVFDRRDSMTYWSTVATQANRLGDSLGYVGNQSLSAMLLRFGLSPAIRSAGWLILLLALLVLTALAMRRALHDGQVLLAVSLNGIVELLASPISWSQHWIWAIPLVLSLAVFGWRTRTWLPIVLAFAALLLFTIAPQWWMPNTGNREYRWDFWQQLLGNSYVYFGMLLLIGLACRRSTSPTSDGGIHVSAEALMPGERARHPTSAAT